MTITATTAFKRVVNILKNQMKGSHLSYHNSEHVNRVVTESIFLFEILKPSFPSNFNLELSKVSLILAALAHDIVYIPGSKYNELVSADWMDAVLSEFAEFDKSKNTIRHDVHELICGTAIYRHLGEQNESILQSILLDADLTAMSDMYQTFERTQFTIMFEQLDKSASIYKTKEFLRMFLDKKRIYRTDCCPNRELMARDNISKFIAKSNEELQIKYENYILGSVL